MSFDTILKQAARDMLSMSGESVTYRGGGVSVSTNALISQQVDLLGAETEFAENRTVGTLLVEDVGKPQRGDTLETAAGVTWVLQETLPSTDEWISEWSVTRK